MTSPDVRLRIASMLGGSSAGSAGGRLAARLSVRSLAAVAFVLTVVVGAAWAYWSAGSEPGGNGASAATVVQQAETPTAEVDVNNVTVDWVASTLANGDPVTGYTVQRYDADDLAAAAIQAACGGTIEVTTCTEGGVPPGRWRYSVSATIGASWVGPESGLSNVVTIDSIPPVNALSITDVSGNAVKDGDTVYYRGASGGSFTLTNAVSDAGSGPASSQTTVLGGDGTGWTHTASTVVSPTGGPYVSNAFGWTAGTTTSPTEAVTGRDVVGNTAVTTLSFVDDSAAPTGAAVDYPDGYQPAQSVVVTLGNGSDVGSGIATRQLQRSSSTISAGLCGTFAGFANIGSVNPSSPYTDTDVVDGSCYQYRYLVTDRLGNQAVASSAKVAKVDSSFGGPPLGSAASYSVLAKTGVTNTLLTTVSGDLGVSPSPRTSITGFPPGIVAGSIHAGDAAAAQAQADLVVAYDNAVARPFTTAFSGDQIGKTFHPGVHRSGAAFLLTGAMTLDGDGDPNAVFIFQIGAAMSPAAGGQILLIGGAKASNVYWAVDGAVTIAAASSTVGTIMATGDITLGNGVQLIGRAHSYGMVTMANTTVRFTTALPPTVAIDGDPPTGATDVTKDTTPTITGTTNAVVGTAFTVKVGGQVLSTTVQPGGTWTVTAAELTAGTHTVVATVRDAAGNNGSDSQELTVEVNPDPVVLGNVASYSVLGSTGVVGTTASSVTGDLGLSPSGAISGFPPGVSGDIHDKDAAAAAARADFVAAYNELNARVPHQTIIGDDLGGQTFHAGIYHKVTALGLTGTVTLDAQNLPNQIFIFQVDAAFDTAASANVNLINGAKASNVFWQVEGAMGTGGLTTMSGTILAQGAITLGAGTQLIGRAMSLGAVNLAGTTVRFTTALAPSIAITGGATAVTKDTSPTIAGTTSAAPGRTVTVKVAGQVLTTSVVGGAWSVTASSPLSAGTYPVTASVRDADGNAAVATQALTVEVNPAPVTLGSAATYSILSGTSVVNTGLLTHLSGDLGVSPAGTASAFTATQVDGATHVNDSAAASALASFQTTYDNLKARLAHSEIPGQLGGKTYHAGIYHSTAALAVTGTLTLDAENLANQVFIFQGDAAMNTAAAAQIVLVNGAQASNVFFVVTGAVGTGAGTQFQGTILSGGAVTLDTTVLTGRALSVGTTTMANTRVTTS